MKSQTTKAILRRLMAVDAALAAGGLHIGTLAERFSVSGKTIQRDVAALAEIVGSTAARLVPTDVGHTYLHSYTDRRRRLFSPAVSRKYER